MVGSIRFTLSGSTHQVTSYSVNATLGGDYTLGVGNGLAFTLETMVMANGDEPSSLVGDATISSLMGSYPLGLLDNLMLLGAWNWTLSSGSLNFLWRRSYDYLSLDLGLSLDTGWEDYQSRLTLCVYQDQFMTL
jgi:hypothetical protein